jgi:heptosyltransferase-2
MLMKLINFFERYAAALTQPAHGGNVFSNVNDLKKRKLSKRVWSRAKRDLVMFCTLQHTLVNSKIPTSAKRILYVYLGNPNLGDSIMDLSPRTLWAEKGLQVDIYTNSVIASFYKDDPSFHKIISDPKNLAADYDFIVLQSYSWKCLRFKWRHYLFKPFVSLHGHYYGCEFNRLVFAEAAWRDVMQLPSLNAQSPCPAVFNLSLDHTTNIGARTKNKVALAVGGIVDWRTYGNWSEVVAKVNERLPDVEWVLIGSENGIAVAEVLMQCYQANIKITNLVRKISLNEVFRQLQNVSLLVAADGGLMNVGRAAKVPIVALFAREIHPLMRFSECDMACAIHAADSVSDIPFGHLADVIIRSQSNGFESFGQEFLGDVPECTR